MSITKGYSSNQKLDEQKYLTLQQLTGGKVGADMLPKAVYSIQVPNFIPEGGTVKSIKLTAHQAIVGDMIRFDTGVNKGLELTVSRIETNEIFFDYKLGVAITPADEFKILKYLTLTVSSDGSLQTSQGPVQIVKDAAVVQVNKDTVDPNNTVAMPVEIVGADGAIINITAGDINIQTSHAGANPDSIQVGNGTNIMDVNANKEALTKDTDVLAELVIQKALLTSLDGKDFSTATLQGTGNTTLASILAKIIAAPSTEAKQDTSITALGDLLTELQLKADLTETQPVSLASQPLPTGAATEVTLAALLAKVIAAPATEAKQDASILSTDAITAKLIAAPATEAKQDNVITELGNILAKIIAAPATEAKQDASILSIDAITAKLIAAPATEAKQDAVIADLDSIKDNGKILDVFQFMSPVSIQANPIPASGAIDGLVVMPLTSTRLRKIQTIEDVGEFLGLYSGGSGSLVLECILPIAGGIVEVDIPAGRRLTIKNLKNAQITTDTYFSANLIG